jgi:hypothetical protein
VKVYIAAAYGRHADLQPVKRALTTMGHEVVSRWLDREHKTVDDGRKRYWDTPKRMAEEAQMDLRDVDRCELIVLEGAPEGTMVRGGKHVEFGYAMAKGAELHVVGERELMFHHLPTVTYHQSWFDFLAAMAGRP